MGNIMSYLKTYYHLFPVGFNTSQSYEPLLLENEREAVADLLQFLESTRDPYPECAH